MEHGAIIGTGRWLPARVVANTEIAGWLGTDEEWIRKQTGIRSRHWAYESETTSDLAVEAARLASRRANVPLDAIDYLIAGTMTPDYQIPGIGPLIQVKLGLSHIPCLDLRAACCNPLYAFDVGTALVRSGRASQVLVVGAEIQSKGLQLTSETKDISALFGDGAGACIISQRTRPGAVRLVDISLFTDGTFAKDLAVLAPGTGNGSRWYEEGPPYRHLLYPVMNGKTVILQAVRKLSEAARSLLLRHEWSIQDIHLVIPHQANANLLRALGRQLQIPASKIVSIIEWSGNTSSASLLMALDWAYDQEIIRSGHRILFLAFGAGFSWGAALGEVE